MKHEVLSDIENTPPPKRVRITPKTPVSQQHRRKAAVQAASTFSRFYADGGPLDSQTDSQQFTASLYENVGKNPCQKMEQKRATCTVVKHEDNGSSIKAKAEHDEGWNSSNRLLLVNDGICESLDLRSKLFCAEQELEDLKKKLETAVQESKETQKQLRRQDAALVRAGMEKDEAVVVDAWIAEGCRKKSAEEALKYQQKLGRATRENAKLKRNIFDICDTLRTLATTQSE
ncbi:hypothetical protein V5O48_014534 [Marasmius crinis-equi]|uniref:Uncharacterized protein n=1 Tax=Marasmius crinis-equi TaxID=585013 RepID=A0ABR3EX17_9AGAR